MTPELPAIPDGSTTIQVVMLGVGWLLTVAIPAALAIWERVKKNRADTLMREALNAATIGHGSIELAHKYALATGNAEAAATIERIKGHYAEIMQRAAPRVDVLDALIRDAKAEVAAIFSVEDNALEEPLANAFLQTTERRAALLEGTRPVPVRSKLYASTGRVRPSTE